MTSPPKKLYSRSRLVATFILLCSLLAGIYLGVRYYHLDYHINCWIQQCNQPKDILYEGTPDTEKTLALDNLRFDIHNKIVARVDDNLSGITYNHDLNQLIAVTNRPPSIVVLDTDGHTMRHHPIIGANDTEGIAYLGSGQIALLQEKRRSIILATIPEKDNSPIIVDETSAFKLNLPEHGNNGPEGLAYLPERDIFYIVKEHSPIGLYTVQGLLRSPEHIVETDISHCLQPLSFLTDLSAITFDAKNQLLILLSDRAQMLVALDVKDCSVHYHFDLAPWNTRIPPPQPEGLAITPDGTVYVVSEPNLFYRLRPQ